VLSTVFTRVNTPVSGFWAFYDTIHGAGGSRSAELLTVLLFCIRIASYGVGGFGFLKSNLVTIYLLLISHLRGELYT
jgi:hypothetical protein